MDGDWGVTAAVISVLLFVGNAFFVIVEYAYVGARRSKVESLGRRGNKAAASLAKDLKDLGPSIAAAQVAITMLGIGVGAITEPYITAMLMSLFGVAVAPGVSFGISLVLITYFMVVVGELIPKYLTIKNPEWWALVVYRPFSITKIALFPLTWLVQRTANLVMRPLGVTSSAEEGAGVPKDELLLLVRTGGAEGLLDKKHADLVSRALRLDQLSAQDIMIHRLDIRWIDHDTPNEELFKRLGELPHTRLPVCRGDIDDVAGIVYIHDVIKHWNDPDFTLQKVVREAVAVPENLSLDKIIGRMREAKTQMLIVMDEYGGTSGLITLEDVVEEVFGELEDKLEHERPAIDILPSGRISCRASVRFDELVLKLGLDLPDEPSTDTLATLIVSELGHVPKPGDHIEAPIGMLIVENMARRRITRVGVHLTREWQERLQGHEEP